jgi:hypothetical protein
MLDTKILKKIQRKAIQAIINKLGVNKSFPQCIAFGPNDLCGMVFLDMSVEQGVHGIQHFMDHVFSRASVGNMMLIALQSLQLESGCGFHLLENPSKWVPYIKPCWLTCIQDILNKSKIMIKVASARRIQPVGNMIAMLWMRSKSLMCMTIVNCWTSMLFKYITNTLLGVTLHLLARV